MDVAEWLNGDLKQGINHDLNRSLANQRADKCPLFLTHHLTAQFIWFLLKKTG